MGINKGYVSGVNLLSPHGTNSTHFTSCCDTAICDSEALCPGCKNEVIGHDAKSHHERRMIRWRYATSHWDRTKK